MKTKTMRTPGSLTLKEITDGTPDCDCKFVPGKLDLQRCPLHAAAPDLLAAARLTIEQHRLVRDSAPCPCRGCALLRAVVAKADGRIA